MIVAFLYKHHHLLYAIGVTLLFLGMLIANVPDIYINIPLLLAFIPICINAITKLFRKEIGTEFFLTIATLLALLSHEEHAITIVLLIMLFAEYLEELIEQRTENAISSLISLIPANTLLKTSHGEQIIAIKDVRPGMLLLVKTGTRIPVDGIISKGTASINEAALTGESDLKEKTVGDLVFAGTFLENGSIDVTVEKVGAQTFFGKISNLILHAPESKAKISRLTDKIALYLVPALLVGIGVVWLITKDTKLAITLLVFGSPLELTIIPPLTILAGIVAAFNQGILVKGGIALERLAHVDTFIFDKTGTLTLGEPEVIAIDVFDTNYTHNDIIKLTAMAEKRTGHVLAKALLTKAQEKNIIIPDPDEYTFVTGHGVHVNYQNKSYYVGSRHFLEAQEHGNITFPATIHDDQENEHTTFYLSCNESVCARIVLADQIRPNTATVIDTLKNLGLRTLILSGDRESVVNATAKKLGIQDTYSNVMPDEKLNIIKKLQESGHKVAMIGDGINDAPALKQADVGIALGAMGMEPAIEAADIVLMPNDLSNVSFVYKLAGKTLQIINQNIFIGFLAVHGIGILLAFMGVLTPIKGALFHAVPEILILLNAARLINYKKS